MGSVLKEFKRNRSIWTVYFAAMATLLLVNKLELPFARTLVVCDEPVASHEFTGSLFCGDRAYVITRGQRLSSDAQSQESLAKFVAMLFVGVMCDVVGRRPAVVLGLSCVALSVVCHLAASVATASASQSGAFWLFTLGQALQGAYPAELIGQIVAADMMRLPGADPMATGQLGMGGYFIVTLVSDLAGSSLNGLNLVDFRPVWAVVLLFNVSLVVCTCLYLPETKPDFDNVDKGLSMLGSVKGELLEFGRMSRGSRKMQLLLASFFCYGMSDARKSTDFSFLMSHHGMSQGVLSMSLFPSIIWATLCLGFVSGIIERVGEKTAWICIVGSILLGDILITPWILLSPWVMIAQIYAQATLSGYGPFETAVDSRYFDARMTTKFFTMKKLILFLVGVVMNSVYGRLFDAQAVTWLGKMLPKLVSAAFQVPHIYCLYCCWDLGDEGGIKHNLEMIFKDRQAEQGSNADVATEPVSKKKD